MRSARILLAICCLLPAYTRAQKQGTARVFVYSDIALGIGEPMGFRATANCLFLTHHEIGIGYNSYWHKGREVPGGYPTSQFGITSYPLESLSGLSLTYAFVFYPKKHPDQLRYLIRAGILTGTHTEPVNFISYKHWQNDWVDQGTTAFIFQPTINVTPCKAFGLTAGAYILLDKDISGVGLMLGVQIGKVGNHFRYHSPEVLAASRARREKKMFWKRKKR